MSGLELIAGIAGLAGAGLSAAGTLAGGRAQGAASDVLARYERQAGLTQQLIARQEADKARAIGGREAYQSTIEKQLVASRAQAAAAASGAGASDTSVQNILAGIENVGSYDKLIKLYEGETSAQGLEYQGALAALEGANRASASQFRGEMARHQARQEALKTLAGGGASFFEKYGRFLPKPTLR